MKITRKQLRVLIESMLSSADYQKDRDTKKAARADREDQHIKHVANLINSALRGGSDKDYISGLVNKLSNFFTSGIELADRGHLGPRDPLIKLKKGDFDLAAAGTDEHMFEYALGSAVGMAKKRGVEFSEMLDIIGEDYAELFDRNMLSDIKGDFTQQEINALNMQFDGFKDYLKGGGTP
jgi:DNA-binding ferritin-like protein (Dps family)